METCFFGRSVLLARWLMISDLLFAFAILRFLLCGTSVYGTYLVPDNSEILGTPWCARKKYPYFTGLRSVFFPRAARSARAPRDENSAILRPARGTKTGRIDGVGERRERRRRTVPRARRRSRRAPSPRRRCAA